MKYLSLIFVSVLILSGCGKSTDTVETTDAQKVADTSGETLSIDLSNSKVNWRGYKPGGQHYGIIPVTSGNLAVEGEKITGGRFTFDISSLEIHDLEEGSENHGKLYNHLQSEDFFDASNHPEAVFEVTSVSSFSSADKINDKEEFETENTPKSGSELVPGNPTHWINGNLTMRGTTKNIKFPARVNLDNGSVEALAGFNINRTDWGLSYRDEASVADKARDQFIYNTVSVEFDIKAN